MHKFLLTSRFIWMDPKESDLNKYTDHSLKGSVLEVYNFKISKIT